MELCNSSNQQKSKGGVYHSMFYTLQKYILQCDQKFGLQTRSNVQKQKYSQLQYSKVTGEKRQLKDLIKQCPNCKEIWFRVQACPNTVCGQRPSCFWDFRQAHKFCKYVFKKLNGLLKIDKKQQNFAQKKTQYIMKDGIQIQRSKFQKETKQKEAKSKKIGCGQAMNFDLLPEIPDIQSKLVEWFQVASFDQISSKLKSEDDLQKFREQVESKVYDQIKSISESKGEKYQMPEKNNKTQLKKSEYNQKILSNKQ